MKLLLVTHGKLAEGLLSSYRMIVGRTENILSLSLTDEGIGKFSKQLNKQLDEIVQEEKVLILCDMKGGTPYNESLKYYFSHLEKIRIVSGVNLPMLMETSLVLEQEDLELAQEVALKVGKESIETEENETEGNEDYDIDF